MDLIKKFEKIYVGKKVLNYDFTITAAGIAGAVKEFGEQAVDEFFCNGWISRKGDRTVVDALRENAGEKK
jgi:hypothetical protein